MNFRWDWVADHTEEIIELTREHAWLTFLALLFGIAISLPVAIYAHRHKRWQSPATAITSVLYTIPSLALFALIFSYFGLTTTTAVIGLTIYTLSILVRNSLVGLRNVPEDAKEAARGMGLSSRQMLWRVELPLAIPAILAGIRITTVTTIGLVTITALVGKGGLGLFIYQGMRRRFPTMIITGAVLSIALAVIAEIVLLLAERGLTPWSRARPSREAG
jgi:osmoprotectant transport system permease protein